MNEEFDGCLEAEDWRYSAAIVGLARYLVFCDAPSNLSEINEGKELDCLKYYKADITEERYLEFAEYFYGEEFQHVKVERMLKKEEYSDEEIKEINALLVGNTVLKKYLEGIVFDGKNRKKVLENIHKNRLKIIRETFQEEYKKRNKKSMKMYGMYCNTNQLFKDTQKVCRLNGYYIDFPKKGKSASYCQNSKMFVGRDLSEFDFIPFAFAEYYGGYFINYNATLRDLISKNNQLRNSLKAKKDEAKESGKRFSINQVLFEEIIYSAEFLKYDVELILKKREHDFFETVYLRKKSIGIFRSLASMKTKTIFNYSFKITEDYYRFVLEEVMNAIINLTELDDLIEFVIKQQEEHGVYGGLLVNLITLNETIYKYIRMSYKKMDGGDNMDRASIKECAVKIAKEFDENKLKAYRSKLTSALVFKDYDRVCEILLQLSNTTGIYLGPLMNALEDCEEYKNSVYLFVANLFKENVGEKGEGGIQ